MARIRTVKPEFPKHRKCRQVSRDARLLNIHLWNLADDEGRLQELPQWIIGEIFPTDDDVDSRRITGWLQELSNAGLIHRYTVAGERYIQCHDFNDHQTISHKKKSVLPPLEQADSDDSSNVPGAFQEPSCQEGNGREGNREQGTGRANAPVERSAPDASAKSASAGTVRELFAYWQQRCGHPNAKLTNDRKRKVQARLREGYSEEQIRVAIDGAAARPFVSDDGKVFDDLELICRNGSKLEDFIDRGSKQATSNADFVARLNARSAA